MYKSRLLIVVFSFMVISCDNPFLPNIEDPFNVPNPRSTPVGVISQLFQSYDTRRIELFTAVLSKDFKFYVASGFDKTTFSGILCSEKPDAFMQCVNPDALYDYWGYDDEYKMTLAMFSNAEIINIPSRPEISSINYNYSGDTTYAEVKVDNVNFEVSRYESGNNLVTYSLVNQPQVFLLERVKDNLWVIKKWFASWAQNKHSMSKNIQRLAKLPLW